MTAASIASIVLLGAGVALCLLSSLGILVMRDSLQRLHYPSVAVSLGASLITIAVFLQDSDATMRVKSVLVLFVLFFMNGILSHLTARADFIARKSRWRIEPSDRVEGP